MLAKGRARRATATGRELLAVGRLQEAEQSFRKALEALGDKAGSAYAGADPEVAVLTSEAHLGLGRIYLAGGDPRRADPEFDIAQRLHPAYWQGFYGSGCAAAMQGDFGRADWNFTAVLQRKPDHGKAYVRRAYARLRLGQTDAALADFSQAAHHRALDDAAWQVLASIQLHQGDWAGAESSMLAVTPGGLAPEAETMLAFAHEQQGKIPAALASYRQAIARGHATDAVHFRCGSLAYRLGRFDEAQLSFYELWRRHPQDARFARLAADTGYAIGIEVARRGELEAAIPQLEWCNQVRSDRGLSEALVALRLISAVRRTERSEFADARRLLGELPEGSGRFEADRLHVLALVEFLDGDPRAATAVWTRMLAKHADDPRSALGLAMCAIRLGRPEDAAPFLDSIVAAEESTLREPALRARAALFIRTKKWNEAIEALESLPANDSWRSSLLPECLYRAGRYEEVLSDPNISGVLWNLANLAYPQIEVVMGEKSGPSANDGPDRLRREYWLHTLVTALNAAELGDWAFASMVIGTARSATVGQLPITAMLEGIALLYGADRESAIRLFTTASREMPDSHVLTHAVALGHLHRGSLAGNVAQCIAAWGALLYNKEFWQDFLSSAEDRYQADIEAAAEDSLRYRLREFVGDRLPDDEARLLWEREVEAAHALELLGGFPIGGMSPQVKLICGPLRIGELGMSGEFGRFAATAGEKRVLHQFSVLGLALCHLDGDRPQAALELLADLRCPRCRQHVTDLMVCEEACPQFAHDSPAYAGRPSGRRELAIDAVELSIEALLRIAQAELTKPELRNSDLGRAWFDAHLRAAQIGIEATTVRRIVDMALVKVDVLQQRGKMGQAIDVLDVALDIVPPFAAEQVIGRLANLLTERGIHAVDDDIANSPAAITDMQRALGLNPHLTRARTTLANLIRHRALACLEARDLMGSFEALQAANAVLTEGLRLAPGHGELTELQADISGTLETVYSAMSAATDGRRQA